MLILAVDYPVSYLNVLSSSIYISVLLPHSLLAVDKYFSFNRPIMSSKVIHTNELRDITGI